MRCDLPPFFRGLAVSPSSASAASSEGVSTPFAASSERRFPAPPPPPPPAPPPPLRVDPPVILEMLYVEKRFEARRSSASAFLSAASDVWTAGALWSRGALSNGGLTGGVEPSADAGSVEPSVITTAGGGGTGASTREKRLI